MNASDHKTEAANPGFSQEDWDTVSDNPELTDAELAELRPAREMPPELYARLPKRGRGRPRIEAPEVNLTLRIDPAVVDAYRATGTGWQTRMHDALERGIGDIAKAGGREPA